MGLAVPGSGPVSRPAQSLGLAQSRGYNEAPDRGAVQPTGVPISTSYLLPFTTFLQLSYSNLLVSSIWCARGQFHIIGASFPLPVSGCPLSLYVTVRGQF